MTDTFDGEGESAHNIFSNVVAKQTILSLSLSSFTVILILQILLSHDLNHIFFPMILQKKKKVKRANTFCPLKHDVR